MRELIGIIVGTGGTMAWGWTLAYFTVWIKHSVNIVVFVPVAVAVLIVFLLGTVLINHVGYDKIGRF